MHDLGLFYANVGLSHGCQNAAVCLSVRVQAAETVKVTTEERDPTYWQMNDKVDKLYISWMFDRPHSLCVSVTPPALHMT